MNNPDQNRQNVPSLALIGFGEAGQAFARGWSGERPELTIRAFDLKVLETEAAQAKQQDYTDAGIAGCLSLGDALHDQHMVFSLVTADQAHQAACDAAQHIMPGAYYFDANSCAPSTKIASAAVITAAGGRYVDMAVMGPVHPKLHKVAVSLSGPEAQDALVLLAGLGMQAQVVPGDIGRASSIKMMRSVMVKGLEALALECMLSARKAGVDQEVLTSFGQTFPGLDWVEKIAYDFERTTTHGVRRAAEMREVAKTVEDLGLMNSMSRAIVDWQQKAGDLGITLGDGDAGAHADTILSALAETEQHKRDR